MLEQVRPDASVPALERSLDRSDHLCNGRSTARGGHGSGLCGGGDREGDGSLSSHQPLSPGPFPPCFGQARTLKEEKKHDIHRIQELERSLSELQNQVGKMGLARPGRRTGIRGLWGWLRMPQGGGWMEGL